MNIKCCRIVPLVIAMYLSVAYSREYPEVLADFPFIVSVTITSNGEIAKQCTGTIVSENHVMTSMRCLYIEGNTIVTGFVRAGYDIIDSANWRFAKTHPIKMIFRHSKYSNYDYRNNVALISVYNFFDFTTHINEIPMNWDFICKYVNVKVIGYMGDPKETHKNVRAFDSVILSMALCRSLYGTDMIHSETLCIARNPDMQYCQMAPGAIVVFHNKLIAVLTHSTDECRSSEDPYMFTLVAHYTMWMNKIIDPQIFDLPSGAGKKIKT